MKCDVAIVGGGPAGATLATLLRKYRPELSVAVFERERFPRDHVGESLLPGATLVLDEMGVWGKVEAAGFPIKLGATLLWGRTKDLWSFDFVPVDQFRNEPRPAKFQGQRRSTAFQVDRAIYDKILLDHAAEKGADVYEESPVARARVENDEVIGLELKSGETVTAEYYVDASGRSGVIRRALGIREEVPTRLQNVAFWDYWQNADWGIEIGNGGTRIQVISVDYGWIWFIPLTSLRTSIGFVTSADFYKKSGKRPEELYRQALADSPHISLLMENAKSESRFTTTTDWSFVVERTAGKNWFLVGESAGFADPILSAGLTFTHVGAQELAYTINEIEHGQLDPEWLKKAFNDRQLNRVRNHIRFADYWYSANGQLKDLKEYTAEIARDQGLDLDPEQAWRWLALGGFIDEDLNAGTGTFTLDFIKSSGDFLSELSFQSPLQTCNVFELDVEGAETDSRARYENGRVMRKTCLRRAGKSLPIDGVFDLMYTTLKQHRSLKDIVGRVMEVVEPLRHTHPQQRNQIIGQSLRALEALTIDGWVKASMDPSLPTPDLRSTYLSVHWESKDRVEKVL